MKKKQRRKKIQKPDQQELSRLAVELQNEVRALEGTHPRLVETVNELCVMLSRLGI